MVILAFLRDCQIRNSRISRHTTQLPLKNAMDTFQERFSHAPSMVSG